MTPLLVADKVALPRRLKETSLRIEAGELVCLIGPNGSGKTSLLHALAGVGNAAGSVKIAGVDPRRLHSEQRRRLFAFLPASREVKWPVSASDLIRLGNSRELDAKDVIDRLKLEPLLHRRVDQLSTGERSRVLLARVMAADPAMLFLDEPVANLDPLWQLRLLDYLAKRVRDGEKGVVLAIHDLQFARAYADTVIVMNRGAVVASGPASQVFDSSIIPDVFGVEWSEGGWRFAQGSSPHVREPS